MKNILLVDDDIDDSDLFKEALADIDPDMKIQILHSGKETIVYLSNKHNERPEIIFIDVNMPVMSGWECLELLKKDLELNSIPVVMYSTSSYRGDSEKAAVLGALCFFTKPSSFTKLKYILQVIMKEWNNDVCKKLKSLNPDN